MIRFITIFAVAVACALTPPPANDAESILASLTHAEMAAAIGGVGVTEFRFPPHDNYAPASDNLQFRIELANSYASKGIIVGLFSGSQKYGETYVEPATVEELRWRTMWPIDTIKRDVEIMYSGDSGWTLALNDSIRENISLPPTMKVGKVMFYYLRTEGGSDTVSVSHQPANLIDNIDNYYYYKTTNSIDAINSQCNLPNLWQYRTARSHFNVTVPEGCTRIRWYGPLSERRCHTWKGKMGNMIDDVASQYGYDPDDYIHIIFVNSFEWWNSSTSSYDAFDGMFPGKVGGLIGSQRRWLLVRAGASATRMTEIIAHEIGHGQDLCHVDDTSCEQHDADHNCNDPSVALSDRNLMCSGGGRTLDVATQCPVLGAATRYKDWL